MKKLICAFSAMAVAVVANAASVTWSAGMLAAPTSATDGTPGMVGLNSVAGSTWIATLYVYSDNAGENQVWTDSITLNVSKEGTASTTKGSWGTTGITSDAYTYGDVGLTQNTGYYMKLVIKGETADYTAEKTSALFAVSTGGSSAKSKWKGGEIPNWASSSWTVAAIPEPTSGLLLLLGFAGLALRRRRS